MGHLFPAKKKTQVLPIQKKRLNYTRESFKERGVIMAETKQLLEEEYSEARKEAIKEIKRENSKEADLQKWVTT